MAREQLNLRCPAGEIDELRQASLRLGYGARGFSSFVRDACKIYGGLIELEDDAERQLIEQRRAEQLERIHGG